MKPGRFEYFRPESLDEALNLKFEFGSDASIIAGGQSLIPVLNFRLGRPAALIDLGAVSGLERVEIRDGELLVRAMARQRTVELDSQVSLECPLLTHGLRNVAHSAIRNRGTVGGSVAHADPSAEIPAVLVALGGSVHAANRYGRRIIPASDFFEYELSNTLGDDEILVGVTFPLTPRPAGSAFVEYSRRSGDFAIAGVGVMITPALDGSISEARIGFCGISSTPVRATTAEEALRGREADETTWAEVAEIATLIVDSIDESQASVKYRRHLVRGLVAQALREAWERAKWQQ